MTDVFARFHWLFDWLNVRCCSVVLWLTRLYLFASYKHSHMCSCTFTHSHPYYLRAVRMCVEMVVDCTRIRHLPKRSLNNSSMPIPLFKFSFVGAFPTSNAKLAFKRVRSVWRPISTATNRRGLGYWTSHVKLPLCSSILQFSLQWQAMSTGDMVLWQSGQRDPQRQDDGLGMPAPHNSGDAGIQQGGEKSQSEGVRALQHDRCSDIHAPQTYLNVSISSCNYTMLAQHRLANGEIADSTLEFWQHNDQVSYQGWYSPLPVSSRPHHQI